MSESSKGRLLTIILTGLSGAGKSVALNAFEDNGYFCVDNLPLTLIETFINLSRRTPAISRTAIGIDIREKKFLSEFSREISSLRKHYTVKVIFLEADKAVLIRRFKETRRPHPLGYKDLSRAIQREIKLLSAVRGESDVIIDTSSLTPHQLRKLITDKHIKKAPREMTISLVSFGYKFGIPSEADLLFDVRFLPNPNFIEELKAYPGTSEKVRKFVLSKKETVQFFERLIPLLSYIIPLYRKEGRSYLTIGIGCTGGRHRSPAISERLREFLGKQKFHVTVNHRDLQLGP